ncbi:hypothetical protein LJR098_002345 [Rhizobium sp. LjRoot98]|uniref:DUF6894 family protein n=1 Tax=unclassified Rhizobium TaxID=2613769 RepID=UPI0007153442|nr:hypothetical protein [Rhizobium sp. Root1204]KQV33529.1 hypothetical protein ASC96_30420 [Rhizobium sp. Root1204]
MTTRYFFDIHNGDGQVIDDVGMLISSKADLPREVARIMSDIARDELPYDEHRGIVTVKVRDGSGKSISVGSLTFTYEVTSE